MEKAGLSRKSYRMVVLCFVLFFSATAFYLLADTNSPQTPPDSGALLDFSSIVTRFTGDAHVELTKTAAGDPAIKATFDGAVPGPPSLEHLSFPVPSSGWNLSGYKAIKVDVTNTSTTLEYVRVRIDSPGQNFDINGVKIPSGETRTVTVPFGLFFGQPSKRKLNTSKISGIMLYIDTPDADTSFILSKLQAIK